VAILGPKLVKRRYRLSAIKFHSCVIVADSGKSKVRPTLANGHDPSFLTVISKIWFIFPSPVDQLAEGLAVIEASAEHPGPTIESARAKATSA